MKYVCKICGYVYDDETQAVPFSELPDSWVCPLCGAAKSDFEPQGAPSEAPKPKTPVKLDDDMRKLSTGELAALCSNLARGCEKQYVQEESELFLKLADYFSSITPEPENASMEELSKRLQHDLNTGYPGTRSTAGELGDRGALRVCAWGEKVTLIVNSLLERYKKEGEAFLTGTEVWICTVCGFVYVGETPPELCPVCKVPAWKFEKSERRGKR